MTTFNRRTLEKMIVAAQQARDNAYAPYSEHRVGAVVLSESGKMHVGSNCEIAHYKGICAEGAAIASMVSTGDRQIRLIVLAGPDPRHLCTPCGDCRQRIREFSSEDTLIHSIDENGGQFFTISELLPQSFGPEDIKNAGIDAKERDKSHLDMLKRGNRRKTDAQKNDMKKKNKKK